MSPSIHHADGDLVVTGLKKSFGGLDVIRGIDIHVPAGERRVIIGPNGAGKTTLFNLVSGWLKPTSGSIQLSGEEVAYRSPYQRVRMGLGRTFQVPQPFHSLTVQQNTLLALQSPGHFRSLWRQLVRVEPMLLERAAELMHEWQLWEKRDWMVHQLSYGEKRRLEILLSTATSPKILLLDEPMAGLTTEERRQFAEMLTRFPRETSILLIDHDIEIALSIAEKVTVLHLGEVITEGTPEEIKKDSRVQQVYLGVGVSSDA